MPPYGAYRPSDPGRENSSAFTACAVLMLCSSTTARGRVALPARSCALRRAAAARPACARPARASQQQREPARGRRAQVCARIRGVRLAAMRRQAFQPRAQHVARLVRSRAPSSTSRPRKPSPRLRCGARPRLRCTCWRRLTQQTRRRRRSLVRAASRRRRRAAPLRQRRAQPRRRLQPEQLLRHALPLPHLLPRPLFARQALHQVQGARRARQALLHSFPRPDPPASSD